MFIDVCIPKDNEEEFILIAEKLGTQGLLFLYKGKEKDLKEIQTKTKVKLYSGNIDSGKSEIMFKEGNRKNVEDKNTQFLYDFEEQERKDSYHYKRSGINQVIAKLIKDKKKTIVIDTNKLLEKDAVFYLGRIEQILMLSKKYNLDLIMCSFAKKPINLRSKQHFVSLIRSLGFQQEAKSAVETLAKKL